MHPNSKKYVVINEVTETTVVRRDRPIFRKVVCPECGGETGMFERDRPAGEPRAIAAAAGHAIICCRHQGEIE